MAANGSKLGVRAGGQVVVLGLPLAEALDVLGDLPADTTLNAGVDGDVVVLFAGDVEHVHAEVEAAWSSVADGGRLWVAYRKGAGPAALNRDTLQSALAGHGLVGVTLVSLDATWSAMRVRPV
jgi:hypothetical protein